MLLTAHPASVMPYTIAIFFYSFGLHPPLSCHAIFSKVNNITKVIIFHVRINPLLENNKLARFILIIRRRVKITSTFA